jgi:hydrogenase maturation protease
VILIVGYGNPLRSDDAVGQRMALILEQRLKAEEIQVMTAYQLTPELVEPIRHVRLVIFIDARVGKTPGTINWQTVAPETGAGAFTHNVSPAILLGAANALYGVTPVGILISIVGATFDYSSELSPELNRMLPILTDQVEEIIRAHSG